MKFKGIKGIRGQATFVTLYIPSRYRHTIPAYFTADIIFNNLAKREKQVRGKK